MDNPIWDRQNCDLVKDNFGKINLDELVALINEQQRKKADHVEYIFDPKSETGRLHLMTKGGRNLSVSGGSVIYEAIRQGLATQDDIKDYWKENAKEKRRMKRNKRR